MTVFLIAVLLLTIGALSLFIFPILPFRREKSSLVFAKRGYIVFVFLIFAVLVPVLYTRFGTPVMRDYPLIARDTLEAEKAPSDMAQVRRLERYLDAHPDDGAVWEQLGAAYRDAALYDQAATAFRNAIEWGIPEDITNWHALAETLIRAHNGRILGEAQKALENVLRYRPDDPKAIYFLGLARLQNKEPQKALALWRHLEQILSAEDPWLGVIQERIQELGRDAKINPASVKPKDPVPVAR
ncbi:MAG TPA: hypothetical protein DD624_02005 [Alphaproteobacteria bacterium]|nr:hypothetical protein [Alphaproteobacteria bacterium]